MKVIDPGHVYELKWLDGEPDVQSRSCTEECSQNRLTFVKREGAGYPGNVGHHPGTTIQEVLRALIDRVNYLDNQIPHSANQSVITKLREAIGHLEFRAAARHGRDLQPFLMRMGQHIEDLPTCPKCLHIGCSGSCHS